MAVTTQGLDEVGKLQNQNTQTVQSNNLYAQKQAAAQKASQQYQAGDIDGAYATMVAVDPSFLNTGAANNAGLQGDVAESKENGMLSSQNDLGSGSIPVQAAVVKGKAEVDAANLRAQSAPLVKTQNADGSTTLNDPKALRQQVAAGGGSFTPQGQINKPLNQAIDSLDKDPAMKDFNTEINGLEQTKALLNGNLPNSQQPIVMKFLTSSEFVKRFNKAESDESPAVAQAKLEQLQNAVAKGTTGQLDPEVQQQFKDIVDTMQHSTLENYGEALHAKAGGVASKTGGKTDANTALKALVPAANPIFQKQLQIYNKLPQQDQQIVDQAKDVVSGKTPVKDPQDFKDALQVLRMHGI